MQFSVYGSQLKARANMNDVGIFHQSRVMGSWKILDFINGLFSLFLAFSW